MGKFKNLTGQKIGRLTVLEKTDKRSGSSVVWKCLCDCGNICYISSQNLVKGTTKSCGCLQKDKAHELSKDLSNKKFGKLTALYKTNKRKDRSVVWYCKCDCGNYIEVTEHSLTKEKGGRKSCGCLLKDASKKASQNKVLDLTGQKFGHLTAIEQDFTKEYKRVHWICKCDCGNIKSVSTSALMQGETISCGCKNSKGEEKICKILKENKIPFEQQKTFNSCRFSDSDSLARFDFFVDNKYLIEYDGEQHYKFKNSGWNTQQNYEKTKEHDEYKNKWCKQNNILLIRIPYTRYKNLCIEDLKLETTSFLTFQK